MIYFGVILLIVGFMFRVYAAHELYKNDSWSDVPVLPNKVVASGIYAHFRHPAYIGTILFIAGLFLIIPGEWRFIVELFVLIAIYINRAQFENYLIELKKQCKS